MNSSVIMPLLLFAQCLLLLMIPSQSLAGKTFTICGTGDSQELLNKLGQAFQQSRPEVSIVVPDSIGSSGGIRMTAEGKCDMGRVARGIRPKEKPFQLTYHLFAISPVVFFANNDVSVTSLSTSQIVDIFSGKITNWSQLGGADKKLYIAKREQGDSSRTVLEKTIPQLVHIKTWAGKTVYTTPETVKTVSAFSGTLSFAPIAMTHNQELQVLLFNNIYPSTSHVQSGLYPLTVPFGLVWKGELSSTGKDFISFIDGASGKKILSQQGVIPAK